MRRWVAEAVAASLCVSVAVSVSVPIGASAEPLSFIARHDYAVGVYPRSVAVGDFNGDGIPDLAVANYGGNTVTVLLGRGDGLFHVLRDYDAGSNPASVAVGDVNGDGHQDLVIGGWNFAIWVLLGNGDGTFQPAQSFPTYGLNPGIALGDLNGDGVLDAVTANQGYSTISVLLGNGDGTFGPYQTYATGRIPVSVAVGDFNRDGRPDLAVANEVSNTVAVFLGNGDGTFQPALVYAAGQGPTSVVMADLNGDGNLDLATANVNSNTVFVDFGNGAGGVNAQASLGAGPQPLGLAVADVDGDGLPDLVVTNSGSSSVSVLLGAGGGAFQAAQAFATGSYPFGVAAADFNGDGLPDLVVTNAESNSVSILINRTRGAVIGQRVAWTRVVNGTATGNSLRKTGGCDGCFDAGAFSSQQIDGTADYAEVEFTAADVSLLRVAGLTHATSGTSSEAIDFGIRLQGGVAEARENGVYRASTAAAAGDSFRVAINAGIVSYLRNGVAFYASAAAPIYPLAFAVALANLDATVDNASITGTTPSGGGGTSGPVISGVSASGVTSSGATITWTTSTASTSQVDYGTTTAYGSSTALDTTMVTAHSQTLSGLTAGTLYHYRVKSQDAGGNLTVSGDYTFTTTAGGAGGSVQDVLWTSVVNATATDNSLQKTSGCDGCDDAGGLSQQQIASGDGYLEFTASETTSLRYAGLSQGTGGTSAAAINFAIRLQSGIAEVEESGVYRTDTTFVTGDVFRIAVEAGTVNYYKNGNFFYRSGALPVYPLQVDASLLDLGSAISNAVISF
jgi:VCBS repeat protein/purple acid phosphatase-like protein